MPWVHTHHGYGYGYTLRHPWVDPCYSLDSDKDEVEVVDEGHSDGHESDEVCMERVLVLIG